MKRGVKRVLRWLLLICIIVAIVMGFLRYRYDTTIRGLAETQVRNATSDLINDAIDTQIAQGNIQYDRIV